jgi:hypothetical protein
MQRFSSLLATLLITALLVPGVFLIAPQRAQAQALFGVGDIVYDPINWIENALSAALDVTSTAAEVAQQVNAYVLEPLAFVLSGEILKLITAGVISFVIGEANGTGIPQFVVDVQESLRTVSNSEALAFFEDFDRYSNSPFAGSIRASLEDDYFSKTALRGFWERNLSTLAQSSALYSDSYLYGDWYRGGLHSWFALTTRTENNPYMLHQRSREQLQRMIGSGAGGATGARLNELAWGNGFMSWCGPFGADYTLPEGQISSHPGDSCIDENGVPRKIKTPGSVIADALNRALGSDQEKIVRMGNVGPQVNQILGNVATVMQTVNFATQILGGEDSGGLFGAGQSSGSSGPRLTEYRTSTGYLGATQSGVYQEAITDQNTGSDLLSRATEYESAWQTIESAANEADSALTDLATVCSGLASSTESVRAEKVAPALAQATTAFATVEATRVAMTQLQAEIAASSEETQSNFFIRIQALQGLSPTASELAETLAEVQTFEGAAIASPEGSITVTGGSMMDELTLISTNAEVLKGTCANGQSSTP